jgi:hypothetical protein
MRSPSARRRLVLPWYKDLMLGKAQVSPQNSGFASTDGDYSQHMRAWGALSEIEETRSLGSKLSPTVSPPFSRAVHRAQCLPISFISESQNPEHRLKFAAFRRCLSRRNASVHPRGRTQIHERAQKPQRRSGLSLRRV